MCTVRVLCKLEIAFLQVHRDVPKDGKPTLGDHDFVSHSYSMVVLKADERSLRLTSLLFGCLSRSWWKHWPVRIEVIADVMQPEVAKELRYCQCAIDS